MKKAFFIAVLLITAINNIYARGRIERYYEYHDPIQYIINMSKEEMFSKLQNILNINDNGDLISIPIRLFSFETYGRIQQASIINDQIGDTERYIDVTFYFFIQYFDNSIFLKGYNMFIAEDLYIPDKIEVERIFRHIIVNYLLEKNISFEHFQNENIELNNPIGLNTISVSLNVPSYNDFRTEKRRLYWQNNIEIINLILEYEWIINRIEFPNEFIFYRYPDYQIDIYDSTILRYDNIIISIWRNVDQYFIQLNLTKEYYIIDVNKLNEILMLINIRI
jgi:hypothetical protein